MWRKLSTGTLGTAALALAMSGFGAAAETKLTLWSHWADHQSKVDFVEGAARAFEDANPGVTIEITWYQKDALYAALSTALRAGQAPDIFYAEPDQIEYMENQLLYDLSDGLAWNQIEDWAREVWSYEDGVYGFPLEAWTVEMYYDRDKLVKLGIELPESLQLDHDDFLGMVKQARAEGMVPISLGVGDRPFPGAFLVHEPLLKKLGREDYHKLLTGEISWSDQRVVETLEWIKTLVDSEALPPSFSSLKLGESHGYFHTNPGTLLFPMGSFYPSRAFNPPDAGGQPEDFSVGIMQFPAMADAACNECKTIAVGGSYVVNAASDNPNLAVDFLNTMATPEMGNLWLETVLVQTGIKSNPEQIGGPHAGYFQDLAAVSAGQQFYFGMPMQVMRGEVREVFTQVFNQAFPAGLMSVEEAVSRMEAAY